MSILRVSMAAAISAFTVYEPAEPSQPMMSDDEHVSDEVCGFFNMRKRDPVEHAHCTSVSNVQEHFCNSIKNKNVSSFSFKNEVTKKKKKKKRTVYFDHQNANSLLAPSLCQQCEYYFPLGYFVRRN